MGYKDFDRDLKSKTIGDALMLYGAEDFLMSWAVDKLVNSNVEEQNRDLDVRLIDGENATAYDILSEARAYSMFSPKRVVVVRNYIPLYKKTADAGLNELSEYVAEIYANPDSSPAILIFTVESSKSGNLTAYAKQLMKSCRAYEFSKLEKSDLSAFVTKRVRSAGKMISSRELHHLMDVSGYFTRGYTIDNNLIDEILMGEGDKFVFNLVDALVAGKKDKALEITETIIREDDAAMSVLGLLTKQFEIMYDALELSDKGMSMAQMAKATGINEYRFKKAYTAAMKYNRYKLKSLLISLYNIDKDIKSGDIDKDAALELFVLKAAA